MASLVPFGLDVESALIAPYRQAPPLSCVAMGYEGSIDIYPWYSDWPDRVAVALRDRAIRIVGHNIAFDMADIASEDPYLLPLIFDAYEQDRVACTQVRQKLCDIAGGIYRGFESVDGETKKLFYGLGDLAKRHLRETLEKSTRDPDCVHALDAANPWRCIKCHVPMYGYFREQNIPIEQWPEGAKKYVIQDVDTTIRVYNKQEDNALFLQDEFRQSRAAFWLRLMMNWGIRTDADGVAELANKTEKKYESIAKDLRAVGLLRPIKITKHRDGTVSEKEPRNMKAIQDRIVAAYNRLGKEVPRTEKDGICVDKVSCQESGDPVLFEYANFASVKKTLSADIPLLERGIFQPIHAYYEELKESGRTGCENPNLQNLRRAPGIRECFVPSCLTCGRVHTGVDILEGRCLGCKQPLTVMICCDYGGLESCTLAEACYATFGYSALGDALNAGKDPHLIFASQIRSESYEALMHAVKPHKSKAIVDPSGKLYWEASQWLPLPSKYDTKQARQTGKVANFGFPGGLGPEALVFFALHNYGVRITLEEAIDLKRVWLDTWPEMREFFNWIGALTKKRFSQVQQLYSNRFRGFAGGNVFCAACNTIFQGLGADIAKAAGFRIARACYDVTANSILFGCRLVLFVHDEFVLLCPEPRAHEAAKEVKRIMLEEARPWLPHVNIDAEECIVRRYSDDKEQVFDRNGRMIPWMPESDLIKLAS